MKRSLILLSLALFVSGCASVSTVSTDPSIPDAPITDTTTGGECDNNIVAQYPGQGKRGSSTLRCTKQIADIGSLIDTLKPESTLLVLDIDDTLLTSDTFFGSDSWFDWIGKGAPPELQPRCKYDMVALNYEAGTQHAVEDEAGVTFINKLSLPKLLLTSRGAYYRGGTERELLAAQYQLPANFLSGSDGISWTDHDTSLKPVDVPISYANGIQMVTGRNKGKLLLELFDRLKALKHGQKFQNIILVDDGAKNINALHAHLPKAGYNYYGYWYRNVTKGPKPDSTDAKDAEDALADWQGLVKNRYANRWTRWNVADGKECGK